MYLTRMPINPARRDSRKLLASPQAMHAAVMFGYPEAPQADGERPRALWRLDSADGSRPVLYIVGPQPPDLTHLVEQAGWPTTGGWETRPYQKFLDALTAGQRWIFRLTANPMHSVSRGPGKRGKRLAHVTVAQQEQWLLERAQRHGFQLTRTGEDEGAPYDLLVRDRNTREFTRRNPEASRSKQQVTIATATYDGVLEVSDVDLLQRTLTRGIGAAKAYGCGLMTLAPTR